MTDPALRIENLHVRLSTRGEPVFAVNGINLTAERGRVLALVGESGSGKSMTVRAVMRLLPTGAVATGQIWLGERDLLSLRGRELRAVRGAMVALAFQNAAASLNPTLTVGAHLRETVRAHRGPHASWRTDALDALARAGLPDGERLLGAYPFELSGGQQQRVALALATVLRPTVLLADEITTALDVTTQKVVLDYVRRYASADGQAVVLITHDLAVAAGWADDLAVMYGGIIVECGPVETLIARPRHPYTAALAACQPRLAGSSLPPAIPGRAETLTAPPHHCPFVSRCPRAGSRCLTEPVPPLLATANGAATACYNPIEGDAA